jgi:hypothetical protein
VGKKKITEYKVCKKAGHDLTLEGAFYVITRKKTGEKVSRCKLCERTKQRNLARLRSGIPLDQPVIKYKERAKPIEWAWMPS